MTQIETLTEIETFTAGVDSEVFKGTVHIADPPIVLDPSDLKTRLPEFKFDASSARKQSAVSTPDPCLACGSSLKDANGKLTRTHDLEAGYFDRTICDLMHLTPAELANAQQGAFVRNLIDSRG